MRQTLFSLQVTLYSTSMLATKFNKNYFYEKKSYYMVRIDQLAHTKLIFVWINIIFRSNFNNSRKQSIKQRQYKPNHTQFPWKGL